MNFLPILIVLLDVACGMRWLATDFAENHFWSKRDCVASYKSRYLTNTQKKLCLDNRYSMNAVHRGAEQTKQECKKMFSGKMWNCSSIDRAPKFGADLKRATDSCNIVLRDQAEEIGLFDIQPDDINTREAAFVQALSAASLAFQFAHDCFANENCSCSKRGKVWYGDSPSPSFHSCMNSMDKGVEFSELFLRTGVSEKKLKKYGRLYTQSSLLRQHNYAVGREVVREKEEIKCRCLSPSQSCTTQICYKLPPFFKDVSAELKKRYVKARQVSLSPSGNKLVTDPNIMLDQGDVETNEISSFLYYHDASPNFCDSDVTLGVAGTKGRVCVLEDGKANNCKTLCCGRGYTVRVAEKTRKCNCRFMYCCKIECDECKEHKIEYICK